MATPSTGAQHLVRSSSFKSLATQDRVPSTPGLNKSVRFSSGTLPTASHPAANALNPSKEHINTTPQRIVLSPYPSSVLHSSLARSQPSSHQQNDTSHQTAAAPSTQPVPTLSASSKASESTGVIALTRTEQVSRVKWNSIALIVLYVGPKSTTVQHTYWSLLRAIHAVSSADEAVDTVVSACRLVFLIFILYNLAEATYGLSQPPRRTRGSSGIRQNSYLSPASKAVAGSSLPARTQITYSSPKTRPSPSAVNRSRIKADSPRKTHSGDTPSPLRAHIAAARSISGSQETSPGLFADRAPPSAWPRHQSPANSPLEVLGGPRLPSALPATRGASSGPLAAYIARRSVSAGASSGLGRATSSEWIANDSDDDSPNASFDSIQLRRALRTLSASVEPSGLTGAADAKFAPSQTGFGTPAGGPLGANSSYVPQARVPSQQSTYPHQQTYTHSQAR